jgi:hypothetical protein
LAAIVRLRPEATVALIFEGAVFDCPLDNFFFSFTEISGDEFKNCVASGVSDEEVAEWIKHKSKQRPRVQIIKWKELRKTAGRNT